MPTNKESPMEPSHFSSKRKSQQQSSWPLSSHSWPAIYCVSLFNSMRSLAAHYTEPRNSFKYDNTTTHLDTSMPYATNLIFQHCHKLDRLHVPALLIVCGNINHLLLVVNSSVNMIIYVCLGRRFRNHLKHLATAHCRCAFYCSCIATVHDDHSVSEPGPMY